MVAIPDLAILKLGFNLFHLNSPVMKSASQFALAALTILLSFSFQSNTSLESEKEMIIGSWQLESYKYNQDVSFSNVPDFVRYIKNITSSHYSWCSFESEAGNVISTGGGSYEISDENYIETTEVWYPSGTGIPGTSTQFEYQVTSNKWTISGYIHNVELSPESGELQEIDSTYMEEVWVRIY